MTSDSEGQESEKERRRQRLAEQLRANLQRRKGQARARRTGRADERQGIDSASGGESPVRERD